jgi:hypothetical protein
MIITDPIEQPPNARTWGIAKAESSVDLSFLSCRTSPEPFRLPPDAIKWFHKLGDALLAFYNAKNHLYCESVEGRQPEWVSDYLDIGKSDAMVELGRAKAFRKQLPLIIRPDVLMLQDGFAICELDSVPGGFGTAARLATYYRENGYNVAGDVTIEEGFAQAVITGCQNPSPRVAIVVSDESEDYRKEMEWLATRMTTLGLNVVAVHPRELSYTDQNAYLGADELRLPVDAVYRFMELYDLPNVSRSELMIYLAKAKRTFMTPPPKAFLEEKLWFALFHHPALNAYWQQTLSFDHYSVLRATLPQTWILDPTPVPPYAIIPGIEVDGRPIQSWNAIKSLGKSKRKMVLKPSGYSELAWGARGVVVGHDVSSEDWSVAVECALASYPKVPWVLQEFTQPVIQQLWANGLTNEPATEFEGRVRLTPYYFVEGNRAHFSTILATICPSDKKKIHGMRDAVMTVCS